MHRLQLWLAKRQLMPKPHCLRVSCGRNLNPSVLQYYHVLHSDLEARNKKFLLQLFKAQWLLYASAPVTSKKNSTCCPYGANTGFVWLSEKKNRLFPCAALNNFYNRDGVCLLRGTFYILRSAHTLYLCVLCGSGNKQRLFRCTALTDWFL